MFQTVCKMKQNKFFVISCMLIALAIVLGAFAAHGLKNKISPYHLDVFQKGVDYHMYHALALLILSLSITKFEAKKLKQAIVIMFYGLVFFSGSLYTLGFFELKKGDLLLNIVGPITPIGGLCLIISWILIAFSLKKDNLTL